MSQVPRQEAGAAAVGVCGVGEGIVESGADRGALRVVRGSSWAGGLLDVGYELGLCFQSGRDLGPAG